MTLEEFQDLLDTHGGRLERWPPEVRRAAEHLVEREPAAREMLDAARRLDDVLAGAAPPAAANAVDALMARVAAHESAAARPAVRRGAVPSLSAVVRAIADEFSGLLIRPVLTLGIFALFGLAAGVVDYYLQASQGSVFYFEYLYSALAI